MSVSHFVSGSAVLLVGWLALTFLTEVPTKPYSPQTTGSVPVSAKSSAPSKANAVASLTEPAPAPVTTTSESR